MATDQYDYRADEQRAAREVQLNQDRAERAERDAASGDLPWADYARLAAASYRQRAHQAGLRLATAIHHRECQEEQEEG